MHFHWSAAQPHGRLLRGGSSLVFPLSAQPQDYQGDRPRRAGLGARPRRRGDRMSRSVLGAMIVLMMSQVAGTAQPQQFDLDVPPTTVAATIQIIVKPSRGAVLLYTGPAFESSVR